LRFNGRGRFPEVCDRLPGVKRLTCLYFGIGLACLSVLPAMAADLNGTWVFRRPGPDGTSNDTYFRLKQNGNELSGFVQQRLNLRKIDSGSVDGEKFHLQVTTMFGGQPRVTAYEGTAESDGLHIKVIPPAGGRGRGRGRGPGGGRFGPTEMLAVKTAENEGMPPAKIAPPELHDVRSNGLAKTPPMGWNSWNHFRGEIDDAGVRGMADAMVETGMKAAGYTYVNIDDTWQGQRDVSGNITTNKRFPDMKALADYVHRKGLKIGIYSSPGPLTCAGYSGSYGHEEQDAKQYAAWGFDYLKYDWCSASAIYEDSDMHAVYQKMGDALEHSGRPILFSLCQYGRANVWEWGPKVSGNSWRTTGDIQDNWTSMSTIGFGQNDLAKWAAPGHWNDPDMLEVGNGGMTPDEYRTHMTLWSMLAAPLLAGNDLRTMSEETKSILLNREMIALDQDKAGHQGHRASQNGQTEIWVRNLANGDTALAMFNRGDAPAEIKATWADLGIRRAKKVRDLWTHKDLTDATTGYGAMVPPHGVVAVRVSK
jgi:alpha-galactosidase